MMVAQSGASELYLNGSLIQRIGVLSTNPDRLEAFNQNDKPLWFPATADSAQVLAVRYALQPDIIYATHFGNQNPGLRIELNTTEKGIDTFSKTIYYGDRFSYLKAGIFGILGIIFFALFLFFPNGKVNLYFSVYSFLLAITWFLFPEPRYPATITSISLELNKLLVFQAIGYLFMLTSVYHILVQKRGRFYWSLAALGLICIPCAAFIYGWGWYIFGFAFTNLINIDITRVALLASQKNKKGAWIIVFGGVIFLISWIFFCLQFTNILDIDINFFETSILSIPVAFAVFLGYDTALTSRALQQKLSEVEMLSAEKQQILATENERLEHQVNERTTELTHKNRELEVEAALEKIRSRSVTMQRSDELKEVISVMFAKLKELGVIISGSGIQLFDMQTKDSYLWIRTDMQEPGMVKLPYDEQMFREETYLKDSWQARLTGVDVINKVYSFEQKNYYFDYVFAQNDINYMTDDVRNSISQARNYIFCLIVEKNSVLLADSRTGQFYSEEQIDVLKRAANVFEQAYTRFLDLQKVEARAREAQIEAALERVRGRTISMQTSDELKYLIALISAELSKLDITLDRSYLIIVDENTLAITWWIAYPEAPLEPKGLFVQYNTYPPFLAHLKAWQERQTKWYYLLEGENKKKWDDFIFAETDYALLPEIVKENMIGYEKVYFSASFNNFGALSIATLEPLNEEQFDIVLRFSKVFDQSYTRFLDLKKKEEQAIKLAEEKQKLEITLSELRATQTQLIQKEKLASLGELTAGIAHEIQNPLNFVNNFSELSVELAKELKVERLKVKEDRDEELENELVDDLIQNQEKINLHGKRASNIVKGMLEHSRLTTGERQLTDLNQLADEYLRLSYHGLRAKNNDFESDRRMADYELITDKNLPLINVVPQEIGRVVLNLLNNAFYAVNQQSKIAGTNDGSYQPKVNISIQSVDNQAVIKIEDNGGGIPVAIRDKIFQPFFTTKPTGEGTGLGLSLAYDIVTKGHGGTLEMETKEGEGTTFIIQLPLV